MPLGRKLIFVGSWNDLPGIAGNQAVGYWGMQRCHGQAGLAARLWHGHRTGGVCATEQTTDTPRAWRDDVKGMGGFTLCSTTGVPECLF